MKIYNTQSRQKEAFQPIKAKQVKMYVCGPTVYDYIHIGNARPAIFFDVVRRYLEYLNYQVEYIVNFTDVDDKLISKSKSMGISVLEVAERFIEAYKKDIHSLGVRPATHNPRVSEHISEIIVFIETLIENEKAYVSEGDVYFRTSAYPAYGSLSHQNLQELQYGIRVEVDEKKKNPEDFVLWKAAKPEEISWDSPWGKGRPGWHIECSAMARKYLGDTLDIHGGGLDLQFPHHECESAQSTCVTHKPLANIWMHNGHIHINHEKMSKSIGNTLLVKELAKNFKSETLRYLILSIHYRTPLNLTDEALQQAQSSVERLENCYQNLKHARKHALPILSTETISTAFLAQLTTLQLQFHQRMQDDFNTADAITAWFEVVTWINVHLSNDQLSIVEMEESQKVMEEFNDILGLFSNRPITDVLTQDIEELIQKREEARARKDFKTADNLRDHLDQLGIVIEDTPQGIRWKRK